MEFHIGKLIKTKLDESEMTVVGFAKAISTTRENAYGIFKRKSIDTQLLMRICEVLKYNFFIDLAEQVAQVKIKPANAVAAHDRNIEFEYLKRENQLLKEMIQLLKEKRAQD